MPNITVMPFCYERLNNIDVHQHGGGQLWIVRAGAMNIATHDMHWLIPAGCVGWIPPGCLHEAYYPIAAQGVLVHVDEGWASRQMLLMPKVVMLTPLLEGALSYVLDDALPLARRELYWLVIADALTYFPTLAAGVRLPRDLRLRQVAQSLLDTPNDNASLDTWALRAEMSRSTFIRRFRAETGQGFGEWRQQLRIWHALGLLAQGRAVTEVALTVGYRSPSAFIQVFRRLQGMTPSAFSDGL